MTSPSRAAPPDWSRALAKAVAIGVVFGALGYGVGQLLFRWFPGLDLPLDQVRWADVAAVVLALALIVAAVGTAAAALRPVTLGRILKLDGPAGSGEIRDARLQAAVLGLSGVLMALPPLVMAMGLAVWPAVAAVAVLLVAHTVLNLRLYRSVDELFRRTVMETGALTFWVGQGVLFLWAAAERLALTPPLTAWDVYVVLMGVYLVASMVVTVRRGLA